MNRTSSDDTKQNFNPEETVSCRNLRTIVMVLQNVARLICRRSVSLGLYSACRQAKSSPAEVTATEEQLPYRFFWKNGREFLQFEEKVYDVKELLDPKITPEMLERWRVEGKIDSLNRVKIRKLTPEEKSLYLYTLYKEADKTPIWQLHPHDWIYNRVAFVLVVIMVVHIVYNMYTILTPWEKNVFNFDYWNKRHHEEHHG
ncbi:hypothetical protein TTRE_0000544501 [Trichuris trichiura]|uniref:Uncharacterized protein n=1 Tax=Trichuris trichiura TaxID=36087 RepID=A0A077ZCC4_TRITR|nr:hypothetical protein TTRE_0000544501 [Trichuris trichiura]